MHSFFCIYIVSTYLASTVAHVVRELPPIFCIAIAFVAREVTLWSGALLTPVVKWMTNAVGVS